MTDGPGLLETSTGNEMSAEPDNDLIRLVFFGEALRALGCDVSPSLLHGPPGPMMTLMDDALERMRRDRPGFTPEEYTLYVMSMLLEMCENETEAQDLKIGASQYILRVAPQLSADFAPILADAHALLRSRQENSPSLGDRRGPIYALPEPAPEPEFDVEIEAEVAVDPEPEPLRDEGRSRSPYFVPGAIAASILLVIVFAQYVLGIDTVELVSALRAD